jgi:hypothetical protein
MSDHREQKKNSSKSRVFCENPYDLETLFESLSIASNKNEDLLFMDRFIAYVRLDPQVDVTEISFKILRDLDLIDQ